VNIDGLRIRSAVRALVIDPEDRVLLVRFEFPGEGTRWALPGGGVEPNESDHEALQRELAEELGLLDASIGPHIWDRLHIVPFVSGEFDGQRERIYLVRSRAFEPRPHMSWPELHAEFLFEIRWWHPHELAVGLPFAPQALHDHLHRLLRDGPPNQPVDVGV
jgi:8-oxo-dGTP pyrophosphatase MutT (NUDIX family)